MENGSKNNEGCIEELEPLNDMGTDKVAPAEAQSAKKEDDGCCPMVNSLRRYPSAVFFMFGNEFCERFSFYGMRAILTLYFIVEHGYSDSKASLFFHLFVAICYFSPLLGSILSDGYFGRFKVILWGSAIYVLGHGLLTMGSIPGISIGLRGFFDFSGLFVIGMATGTIKPCVSAFAADQFPPEMKKEREQFFSFFYFSINAGSFLAIVTTPLLRGRVKCLGSEYCFPLAFGVPAILMAFALFLFVLGWKYYKKEVHKGNIIVRVFKCTAHAVKQRSLGKKEDGKHDHWLDYAQDKYNPALIEAIKSMCSILVMFIPVVFFWALFDQQGSTWVLQARRMSGRIGQLTILPDHMNTFNPVFIMLFIPIFESFIYPSAEKCTKVTALRKMGLGGLLAAVSFVVAGFLQLEVNKNLVPLPNGNDISLYSFNAIPNCGVTLNGQTKENSLNHNMTMHLNYNEHKFETSFGRLVTLDSDGKSCQLDSHPMNFDDPSYKEDGFAMAAFLNETKTDSYVRYINFELEKVADGSSRIYVLSNQLQQSLINSSNPAGHILYVRDKDGNDYGHVQLDNTTASQISTHIDITPAIISTGLYDLVLGTRCIKGGCAKDIVIAKDYVSKTGAADVLVLWQEGDENSEWKHSLTQVILENKVNILWQIPQFFIITLAEILFSISGLEFSYSQAAPSMRSVLQACWLLTVAFGNCIDIAISGSHVIKEPASEFFFYAALMGAVMLVFIVLARRYKYVDADRWDDHDLGCDVGDEEKEKGMAMVPPSKSDHMLAPASSAAHFPGVSSVSAKHIHEE